MLILEFCVFELFHCEIHENILQMKKLTATIERESNETLDDIQDQLKDNVEDLDLI